MDKEHYLYFLVSGKKRVILSEQDRAILPTLVAIQNAGFNSSCPHMELQS